MNELQSVTDIDEVIKYAERRAEGCHQMASSYHTDEGVYLQEETRFQYMAILWDNIHEWLEELKELRKKQLPHGEWIPFSGDTLDVRMKCSICGSVEMPLARHNFCPNCGSDNRKSGEAECSWNK